MSNELSGKRIAFLATDGVEEVEYTVPREAVEHAGARVELVSPKPGAIRSVRGMDPGTEYAVDLTVADADPGQYDALVLPGGVANPDRTRQDPETVAFVRSFFTAGKPVGAICHAPWLLVEADVVRRRTLTSYPSLRTDLRNAGATWVDEEVHVDGNLTTSRNPHDLPAFSKTIVEEFAGRTD